jgi:hypothetical protein
MNIYKVKVKFEVTNDNGKVKYTTETYLTTAVNPTDAEASVYRWLEKNGEGGGGAPFFITEAVETKFVRFIENE